MPTRKGSRGRSRSRTDWKFRVQGAEAHEALDEQIASLTAWCEFLATIKWDQVPRKGRKPGHELKPPPPPPPKWPPA